MYGAIAWAEEAGIEPDKSFAVTKYMLEEDTDNIPLIEYEFGRDGKHLLMANNNLEASRYLPLLKKNLGEGNFAFTIKMDNLNEDLDWDSGKFFERLEHANESPLFKRYGPSTEYTYRHPEPHRQRRAEAGRPAAAGPVRPLQGGHLGALRPGHRPHQPGSGLLRQECVRRREDVGRGNVQRP